MTDEESPAESPAQKAPEGTEAASPQDTTPMAPGAASTPGPEAEGKDQDRSRPVVSRRSLFAGIAGGLAVGAAAGVGGTFAGAAIAQGNQDESLNPSLNYPFYGGAHQVGVETPPQRYCVYMTFDMTSVLRIALLLPACPRPDVLSLRLLLLFLSAMLCAD